MPVIDGQLVRRTLMFCPVTTERFVVKAHTREADCIMIDLEDSIPPWEKEKARSLVKEVIPVVGKGGADVMVRINHPMELARKDVEAIIWPGLCGFMYPKASVPEIQELDKLTTKYEKMRGIKPGSIEIIPQIESAYWLLHPYEVAICSPRIRAMTGGVDLDTRYEIGIEPGDPKIKASGNPWSGVRANIVLACAAAGIQAMGGVGGQFLRREDGTLYDNPSRGYSDLEAAYNRAVLSRMSGGKGSLTVHPAPIPAMNKGYSPSPEEVDRATRGLAAFEEGLKKNMAAINFEGRMLDIPIALAMRQLVDRAAVIAKWDEIKAESYKHLEENEKRMRAAIERAEALEKLGTISHAE